MRKRGAQVRDSRAVSTPTGSDLAAPPSAHAGGGANFPPPALPEPPRAEPGLSEAQEDQAEPVGAEPEALTGRVREALATFEGVPSLVPLRGRPELLDVLDTELSPTHPERAGLRVSLFHVLADGRLRIVPRCWDGGLPTLLHVSRLVAAGEVEPGDFVVKLRLGFKTTPDIRFSIGDPAPGRRAGAEGSVEGALRILRALRGLEGERPAAPAKDLAALVKGAVSEAVAPLQARLDELEESAAGELAEGAEAEARGGMIERLVEKVADRLFTDDDPDDPEDPEDPEDPDDGRDAPRADARRVAGRGRA